MDILIRFWRSVVRWWHRRRENQETGGARAKLRNRNVLHRFNMEDNSPAGVVGLAPNENNERLPPGLPSEESRSFRLWLMGIDDTAFEPQSNVYNWRGSRPSLRNFRTTETTSSKTTTKSSISMSSWSTVTASDVTGSTRTVSALTKTASVTTDSQARSSSSSSGSSTSSIITLISARIS